MTLYHIGYEGLPFDDFVTYLKYCGISTVVDVRYSPVSRKKGFSKAALAGNLSEHGIGYLHLKKIGAPKPMRTKLYESWNYDQFFTAYRKHLRSHLSELDPILDLISNEEHVVLLCYERDPEKCHRKIVAEEVKRIDDNGLKIEPIFRSH